MIIPETLPWGGTYVGKNGFLEMIGKLGQYFEEFKAEATEILDAGDRHVVVIDHQTGRTKAGNEIDGRSAWLYEFVDGQIVKAEFFGDTARVTEALGEHAHA